MRLSAVPTRTALVALAGILALSGCTVTTGTPVADGGAGNSSSTGSGDGASGALSESGAGTGDTNPAPADGGAGDGDKDAPSAGGGTAPQGGGGNHPPKQPAGHQPTIVSFRVVEKPSCPAGTNVNPIPGTPVKLEWKATNVDKVALSVDGPGIYRDDYAPTGTETLNFPCSGAEGDKQKHTYLLTVTNANGKRTSTLTVTATVHEIATV